MKEKKTFLQYVAEDLIKKYGSNLSRIAVVFPNKRASLFLNEQLARLKQPIWSPAYFTISDLFRRHSDKTVGDPVKLICDLHKTYCEVTGSYETLDRFYGWGQLMIADFDDVDKNMADPDKVFANVKDIHEFDDVSFLDEEQKRVLRKFFSNFSEEHESVLKERFLNLWSRFDSIYHQFNENLDHQGLAYEGALYRSVVEKKDIDFEYDTYVFVGFNMMQKVELRLCDILKKQGKAKFYWDYDRYYMKTEAGHYISQYLAEYPDELDRNDSDIYDNMSKPKNITYISAMTENIQARYISTWLTKERIEAGRHTAIVMADESLLPTVIHSLPKEVGFVNVTTGYPLAQTPVTSLVRQLIDLQTTGYRKDAGKFRLHWVSTLIRHPYIKYADEEGKLDAIRKRMTEHKKFYFEPGDLFKPVFVTVDGTVSSINRWLLEVLKTIGVNYYNQVIKPYREARKENPQTDIEDPSDQFFQESLFRMYTLINRIGNLIDAGDLDIDILTYQKLIGQLLQSTSVPFHGEPAEGIQIMGVLETRNLDFDHILVLSCNEGNMPKGVNDASFIPYSIRKAYGLTTVDNKVAIYAYYFHRLLQRAGDITLMYNNATNEGHTGEMSRFMLQMMVESKQRINKKSIVAGQLPEMKRRESITKDDDVMKVINGFEKLSPTALNTYIRCQLRFYYKYVAGIKEPDDNDEDEIDNRIFGNIFHKSAEIFYRQRMEISPLIRKDDIEEALKHPEIIDRIVDRAFRKELFKVKDDTHIEYNGLQIINRQVIIDYMKQLLRIDLELAPFTILGLEKYVSKKIRLTDDPDSKTIEIGGYIDRLDETDTASVNGRIRVIDYKTGANDKLSIKSVEDFFTGNKLDNHSDYFLQAFLYSLIVRRSRKENPDNLPVSPALLFIQHAGTEGYDPTLKLDKKPVMDIAEYGDEYEKLIRTLLNEIFDSDSSFNPTEDRNRCKNCPYVALCGR